jgi:hypothetical protein
VLPTEFKKFFMDELSGKVDNNVIVEIKPKLEKAMLECTSHFSDLFLQN